MPAVAPGRLILKRTLTLLGKNWKLFGGIFLIYALLTLVFVQNIGNFDIRESKESFDELLSGNWSKILGGLSLFAILLGSAGMPGNDASGIYQFIILTIVSLATIWALRQRMANNAVRIRDGFYDGMQPLVPAILVLCVVFLQLIPLAIGVYIFNTVGPASGISTGVEWFAWIALLFLLVILTLYMLSSSIFALYIACLPGMRPVAALRSARKLVRYRRWTVMRRLLLLPLSMTLVGAVLFVPLILFAAPVVPWVFFTLSMLSLVLVHGYIYNLYRELLRET